MRQLLFGALNFMAMLTYIVYTLENFSKCILILNVAKWNPGIVMFIYLACTGLPLLRSYVCRTNHGWDPYLTQ